MRSKLATAATCAVAVLALVATGCAESSTTPVPDSTGPHSVPAVAAPGTHPAQAAPKPGVQVVSDELNDGGGCVGIEYDAQTRQVDIPIYGTAAELCSATIRVRVTGHQPVTLTQRVAARGDGRLIHALRVGAAGVGTMPGDRLPLTMLSTTAQPGQSIVTGLAWRLPAGLQAARGHMMHLIVSYRVSAGP
jgi:hypothetical protein